MANRKSNPAFAFIWMALMGLVLHDAKAALRTTFLEDLCYYQKNVKMDLQFQPTGILMSLNQVESNSVFECEVILSPPRESSVVLSIYSYDLGSNDTLTIEDSDRFKIALTGYGNFKDEKKAIISEGRMVIKYQRSVPEVSYGRRGFQFTYTAAKKRGPCYDNEFQCKNGLCILKEYVCDGHSHCGDGSDQKTCVPKDKSVSNANQDYYKYRETNTHVLWISIIGVAGGIVFIIVIVFIVVVVRMKKSKTTPPTANSNNQTSGGNAALQSVSSTVPQQQPHAPTSNTAPSAPPAPEHEGFSFYNRVRRSLRLKNSKPEDVSKEVVNSEVYQVPSMYPNLDQQEPTPSEGGIVNPEFKSDEP